MREQDTPTARLLAPAALIAFFVVLVIVIFSSTGGSDRRSSSAGPATGAETTQDAASYVVRPGDTLSGIADRTGVSVERLNLLNPDIDPQALISGQRLRLR